MDEIKSLSNVTEVDKVLLMYIEEVITFSLSSKKDVKKVDKLGFCAQQLGHSLKRLKNSGFIIFIEDKGYQAAVNLSSIDESLKKPEYPFTSEEFLSAWNEYLDYRKGEFKKPVRTVLSKERMANKLASDVGGNEDLAIKVIKETMDNRWLGLIYGLKQLKENAKESSSKGRESGSVADEIRRRRNKQ